MSKPILKSSEHYFFKLSECGDFLTTWLNQNNRLQPEARNKMQEWLNSGLQDWDISRDKPYFGFNIPEELDKYFYVWLDAPVGYMSSLMHHCNKHNLNFKELWNSPSTEIYHFIGKDILYFHALFWPSVLHHCGYKTPTSLFVHGFLTANGQKMSKSRGTFITAKKYIESGLSPTFYRYYIASKSSTNIEDLDFSNSDFLAKINSELVGKFINIAARSSVFLDKYFSNTLSAKIDNTNLLENIINKKHELASLYHEREYAKLLKIIMGLADEINLYVDQQKPWLLAKDETQYQLLHQVSSILINAFRLLSIYLKPIIPDLVQQIEELLNIPPLQWANINNLLLGHKIKSYTHLISRVDISSLDKLTKED